MESPPERADLLLDPRTDPGAAALGASGAEASVEARWFTLLHRSVAHRAATSAHYRWWALSAILGGLLSLNITFTVFVVALPTVRTDFHSNFSVLTWSSTGPLLAFGVAAPFFGKAGDLFGHRRLYLFGMAGAMVSAVLTALAPNVGLFLFARALDGVQGAATGTASMALILDLFQGDERIKALGWWSLVGAGGPVLGVTLGSPVIQYLGWRALFWGQLLLLVVASAVVAVLLQRRPADAAREEVEQGGAPRASTGMDWAGSWSLAGSVTAAMLALSIGPLVGWSSPAVVACFALGAVLAAVFVWRELTFATPLIPTAYWTRRDFVFPMGMRAFSNFAYFGAFFLFPLLMEQVYRYSVSSVGFVSVARPLVFAVSSPLAAYLAVRAGERVTTVVGAAAVLASMVCFATLAPTSPLAVIFVALALSGLGMGLALPATSAAMANAVDSAEYGVTSAAQLLATQVGEVAGIQVVLTLQESSVRHAGLSGLRHGAALLHSFQIGFWVSAVLGGLGLVCALAMPRRGGARIRR
jgi:MFS family permease